MSRGRGGGRGPSPRYPFSALSIAATAVVIALAALVVAPAPPATALLPWPVCESTSELPQKVVRSLTTRLSTWCTSMVPRPLLMLAEHGTAGLDAHGRVSYTPDSDFRGPDTISAIVTIGDLPSMYRTSFAVKVIDPAVARGDHYSVPAGGRFAAPVSLLANDELPTTGWLIQQGRTPPGLGTVEIDTVTGMFAYEARPGASGTDTFLYRLSGPDPGAYSNVVTVTLEVG